MDNDRPFEQAAAAQDRLADALVALHETQVDALLGRPYDAGAYDALIARYREARREAAAARAAWQRLLFVRWLYRAGRISG
jgi:hypothetical protein